MRAVAFALTLCGVVHAQASDVAVEAPIATSQVVVSLPACSETFLAPEPFLQRLRVELSSLGVADVRKEPVEVDYFAKATSLSLRAEGCGVNVELRLQRAFDSRIFRRRINLAGLSVVERARLLALVAAELLVASPHGTGAASESVEVLRELPPAQQAPAAAEVPWVPHAFHTEVSALSTPSTRVGLFGAEAGWTWAPTRLLGLRLGARFMGGEASTVLGTAYTLVAQARLALLLTARPSPGALRLSVGPTLDVGWLRVFGAAATPLVSATAFNAASVQTGLSARLALPLSDFVDASFGVDASYTLAGLEVQGAGVPIGGLRGALVGVSVGALWH